MRNFFAFSRQYCRLRVTVVLLITGSCVEVRDPDVQGPGDAGDLVVTAAAQPATAFEGGATALSATVDGGRAPYAFRWDQNGGPVVSIANATSQDASVALLMDPGHYSFRVTVTDSDGLHLSDFVAVDVVSAVTVDGPDFAVVGQPATLTAELAAGSTTPTFLWEVIEGEALLSDPTLASPTLTAQRGETITVRLTASFAVDQPAATRELDIVAVPDLSPRVRVETTMGDFVIELDGENTPRHMVNFLTYVDEGFYEGLLIHRNVCSENEDSGECEPFVIQGGGYRRVGDEFELVEPTHDPVANENETSPSNGVLYTVALALSGPNTGTTQFFVNLDEENAFLDEQDFTVFGLVVEETDVVDAIAASERIESPIHNGEVSLPAEDIVIVRIVRVD